MKNEFNKIEYYIELNVHISLEFYIDAAVAWSHENRLHFNVLSELAVLKRANESK